MPRSFLVKRRKSDSSEFLADEQIEKALTCSTTGYPIQLKSKDGQDTHPPKTLFIEYHSSVPHYIRGKSTSHHGNNGPCYLCHHGNMITPTNDCISYAPLQVPPRYNRVCFCLLCQQRAPPLTCNCQSCLSLRFEQTAASVLQPSDKKLSSNKPAVCCNGVMCNLTQDKQLQYSQYCHCAECLSRAKDFRINNNLQVIVHRNESTRPEGLSPSDKDPNNNDSNNDKTESAHIKQDVQGQQQKQRHNGDISPKAKELTDRLQSKTYIGNPTRKRKHELKEDNLLMCKTIKREKTEASPELPSYIDRTTIEVLENDTRVDGCPPSPIEEKEKELRETQGTPTKEEKDPSPKSSPKRYPKDKFDHKEANSNNIDSNLHSMESHKEKPQKHYNTRHTSTKTHSHDEQELPKSKKDKELYADLSKTISRQRSKLNRLLANEHERRRVAQLNSAYQNLRQLIPGYQCDTKLPKIKILRYAINYIAHLDNILEIDSEKERV